jgi:hypothetical protein
MLHRWTKFGIKAKAVITEFPEINDQKSFMFTINDYLGVKQCI